MRMLVPSSQSEENGSKERDQYEYESHEPKIKFACNEPSIKNSKFCIFHDKEHYAEHEQEAVERFEEIVNDSIEHNKPLECIGYYLPAINFSKLLTENSFAQTVYFDEATFYEGADFSGAQFNGVADFSRAKFNGKATFSDAHFQHAEFFYVDFKDEVEFFNVEFPSTDCYYLFDLNQRQLKVNVN